jgi:hypothetical protein
VAERFLLRPPRMTLAVLAVIPTAAQCGSQVSRLPSSEGRTQTSWMRPSTAMRWAAARFAVSEGRHVTYAHGSDPAETPDTHRHPEHERYHCAARRIIAELRF